MSQPPLVFAVSIEGESPDSADSDQQSAGLYDRHILGKQFHNMCKGSLFVDSASVRNPFLSST